MRRRRYTALGTPKVSSRDRLAAFEAAREATRLAAIAREQNKPFQRRTPGEDR